MSEGEKVYRNIQAIIDYCNNVDHEEFVSLLDPKYSKIVFDLNFPFFMDADNIDKDDKKKQSERYLTNVYSVRDKKVRITSQWFPKNVDCFLEYLKQKDITSIIDIDSPNGTSSKKRTARSNSRYRGNHIGNSQNLLIRNILSNLGTESFNEDDWNKTKDFFNNKCAYCGSDGSLTMDHAIPINKEKLGEHRIGNIVPSCKNCNETKANKDFKEFLGNNEIAIKAIEKYMESRNYVPLKDNDQIKKILNLAYEEVSSVAERYITIINELFIQE
jgi:5-methylcytosine-specific restriction endonuclease McrA